MPFSDASFQIMFGKFGFIHDAPGQGDNFGGNAKEQPIPIFLPAAKQAYKLALSFFQKQTHFFLQLKNCRLVTSVAICDKCDRQGGAIRAFFSRLVRPKIDPSDANCYQIGSTAIPVV